MNEIETILSGSTFASFNEFIRLKSSEDETWQFWANFVFRDCYAYIALYVAIRGSNWHLRLASLKLMAPVFTAFDRDYYRKIIPDHLANLHNYPPYILECFEKGLFTASISGKEWRSVALDEAHEMCVN